MVSSLVQDLRFAIRTLVKRPAFAGIAIGTLALGIGATTAIFTVVNAVLLSPLPYRDPGRLVHVHIRGGDGDMYPLPDTDVFAWRDQHPAFEDVAVVDNGAGYSLAGQGAPEQVVVLNVTARFFDVLGIAPAIGRTFERSADDPGAPRTVVLSYRFWQQHFHGRVEALGQQVLLDGAPHTVVGVMPASFVFDSPDYDMWRAMPLAPPKRRGPFYSWGIGRLAPGSDLSRAAANLAAISASIKRQYPGPNDWSFEVVPLRQQIVGDVSRVLYLLFGAVALLLLIAVANVANLLLARMSSRAREIAVRAALGATAPQIVRQLVVESLVLASVSGAVGLVCAAWGTEALLAIAPPGLPRIDEVRMSLPVFMFTFATATAAGVLFSVIPAWRALRTPVSATLTDGRGGTAGRGHRRVQRVLVAAEIALALMLSTGAGLMIRSVARLVDVNPGFAATHLLTAAVSLSRTRYDTPPKVDAFFESLLGKLQTLPGVESVGSTVSLPPNLNAMTDNFLVEGQTLPPNQSAPVAPLLVADEGFFRTLRVPLVAGRFFNEGDRADRPPVVIVNQTLARRYFPNGDAVGHRLKDGGPERPNNPMMEIVGVVGDVKYDGLDAPPEPEFYFPLGQLTQERRYVVLRTASNPLALESALRREVAALDPELAVARVRTMDELMSRSVAPPRFRTTLVTVFAVAGLLLAAIGIYGVMMYAVSERTRELALRLALGASNGQVARIVLGESVALAAAGVIAGLAGSVAGGRLIASMLFGVAATDPATLASVAAVLVATALVATWVPLRRALRIDPMIALRSE
jgi:putative ABC transport system permease protein